MKGEGYEGGSNTLALRYFVRQLLGNPAGSFSINKFDNDLKTQGIPVAKDTLHAYLGYLEDAFLLRTISLESGSERRRMVNRFPAVDGDHAQKKEAPGRTGAPQRNQVMDR
ncbi:MAG: hypothetical protein H5T74_07865 [Actinobacteria bacterium]|nr:hypothetical protein [Actinomycetota bacterium]